MWTEEKEKQWTQLTEEREKNKKEVGKIHTIESLQRVIDSLKYGNSTPPEVYIEYLRGPTIFGSPLKGPIVGKKITLIFKYDC